MGLPVLSAQRTIIILLRARSKRNTGIGSRDEISGIYLIGAPLRIRYTFCCTSSRPAVRWDSGLPHVRLARQCLATFATTIPVHCILVWSPFVLKSSRTFGLAGDLVGQRFKIQAEWVTGIARVWLNWYDSRCLATIPWNSGWYLWRLEWHAGPKRTKIARSMAIAWYVSLSSPG
jgi:hypothetical protein